MSLERWNPFREIEVGMDRWFGERLPVTFMGSNLPHLGVAVDLHETATGYELTASLPGVKPENLDITLNAASVMLKGKLEENYERVQDKYIWRERRWGNFQRLVPLPEAIDLEQAKATLDHGVLTLMLPRLQASPGRRLAVNGTGNTASDQAAKNLIARPAVLENLTATEMDSLEEHINARDEQGFGNLAQSYGWDESITAQVWDYLTHPVRTREVQKAFKS